ETDQTAKIARAGQSADANGRSEGPSQSLEVQPTRLLRPISSVLIVAVIFSMRENNQRGNTMIGRLAGIGMLALAMAMPAQETRAQDVLGGALLGGLTGG